MRLPSVRDRGGFSLAELAVTVMIVGILAGVALPNLRSALLDAQASRIVSDQRTVSLAAYEYLAENGTFPGSSGYGIVPPQMAPYLPDNFSFAHDGVTYAWFSFNFPNANNVWQTRTMALFVINYANRRDLAPSMQGHAGPDRYWSSTLFYFLYRG